MTFKQLYDKIGKMTPKQRQAECKFVEPYDDAAGYPISLAIAQHDVFVGGEEEDEELFVFKGQPFFTA